MKVPLTAGKFLRKARKSKGENLSILCLRMSMSQQHLSLLENDKVFFAPIMERILDGYKLTEEEAEQFKTIVSFQERVSPDTRKEMDFFYEFMQLPKEVRQRIVKASMAYDSVIENGDKK